MIKLGKAVALSIAMMLATTSAWAAQLHDRYSDDELIQLIKDEGYSAVKKAKEGTIVIKIDGRSYVLFNKDDGDLQAYYGASGLDISYRDINEWNKTKRLSRAYLDSDKDPVIEADLLANGGLTDENVTEFFRVFKISVKAFREFIIENDQS